MHTNCFRQNLVAVVAALAWVVTLLLILEEPAVDEPLRLVFFAALGLAIAGTTLAVFPWMMVGFIRDHVLAYVAGYMHHEADAPDPNHHPDLQLIPGG